MTGIFPTHNLDRLPAPLAEKAAEVQSHCKELIQSGLRLFATSSFQTHSLPMLHLIGGAFPVFFIQTGFHFPETLSFKQAVAHAFGLDLRSAESEVPKIQQRNDKGNFYFTSDPDYCCFLNKTQPTQRLLQHFDVWVNGVRADQNANRASLKPMEKTPSGAQRFHPMLHWTRSEIWQYIALMNLPRHPLDSLGYTSIGCEPCTFKPVPNDDRGGRWQGQQKTECGLHTELVSKP